jgi:HlyD family secretion protein
MHIISKQFRSWRLIVAGIAIFLLGCDDLSQVGSLGTLERERIRLVADSSEPISRILVREGDAVEIGAVLVQQDTTRAEIALIRSRADEAAARSALEQAEAGPRAQQISQARARLQAAVSSEKTASIELDRDIAVAERNLISRNQLDQSQGRHDEAVARRREAKAALDELLEGTRSEEIDQARASHAATLATVQDIEVDLERASIRAPVSGNIESLPFRIGERPPISATVAVLLADGRTYARIHVSEPLRTRLSVGAEAEIRMDGVEQPLKGRLRWISLDAAFTPYFALNQHDRSRLSYVAEVDVIDENNTLPVGVPVEVTFTGLSLE